MSAQAPPAQSLLPYDLAGNFCGECGRPKMLRMLEALTGCAACDAAVTAHRCAGRPDIAALPDGQPWECPECGSRWTPHSREEACPDCCGECGHTVTARLWDCEEGPRIATAPRHVPYRPAPLRDAITRIMAASAPRPAPAAAACYRIGAGLVHVRPGCRCPR